MTVEGGRRIEEIFLKFAFLEEKLSPRTRWRLKKAHYKEKYDAAENSIQKTNFAFNI